MFAIGNLLIATSTILNSILTIYMWIIITHCVLSWVRPDPDNMIVQILHKLTHPALTVVRNFLWNYLPMHKIQIDLSPIIAILGITFIKLAFAQTLFEIGMKLK